MPILSEDLQPGGCPEAHTAVQVREASAQASTQQGADSQEATREAGIPAEKPR